MDKRVKFDFEIEFSNGGGIQGQDFRLDILGDDISDQELASYIVNDMRLLMVSRVRILNKEIITEPHMRNTDNLELARNYLAALEQNHMIADAFRHFYNYHFAENRKIWDQYITSLSLEQFTQKADYSHGSVRDQIVHLMSVDDAWFSDLQGGEIIKPLDPADTDDRNAIRAYWDEVEGHMRAYLGGLRDEILLEKPFAEGEDKDLILWQVLLHVVNHGTDHRAQILRLLNDLGVETKYQDYIFYVYENP